GGNCNAQPHQHRSDRREHAMRRRVSRPVPARSATSCPRKASLHNNFLQPMYGTHVGVRSPGCARVVTLSHWTCTGSITTGGHIMSNNMTNKELAETIIA